MPWCLTGYATNSRFVNHCLITFLQRIADPDGLNLEPMLYQVIHAYTASWKLSVSQHLQAARSDACHAKVDRAAPAACPQVSVLRVLHQVLSDAPFRKQPGASEVLSFAARIVRSVIAKLVPGPADEDACRAAAGASQRLL